MSLDHEIKKAIAIKNGTYKKLSERQEDDECNRCKTCVRACESEGRESEAKDGEPETEGSTEEA